MTRVSLAPPSLRGKGSGGLGSFCSCSASSSASSRSMPTRRPGSRGAPGLYTDEGFYTLDARHEALFGTCRAGRLSRPAAVAASERVAAGRVLAVRGRAGAGAAAVRRVRPADGGVFWLGLRRAFGARTSPISGRCSLGLRRRSRCTTGWLCRRRRRSSGWFWPSRSGSTGVRWPARFTPWPGCQSPSRWCSRAGAAGGSGVLAGNSPAAQSWGSGRTPARPGTGCWLLRSGVRGLSSASPCTRCSGTCRTMPNLARMATYYRVHQMQPHSWTAWG